jgi:hypothetical protein
MLRKGALQDSSGIRPAEFQQSIRGCRAVMEGVDIHESVRFQLVQG